MRPAWPERAAEKKSINKRRNQGALCCTKAYCENMPNSVGVFHRTITVFTCFNTVVLLSGTKPEWESDWGVTNKSICLSSIHLLSYQLCNFSNCCVNSGSDRICNTSSGSLGASSWSCKIWISHGKSCTFPALKGFPGDVVLHLH